MGVQPAILLDQLTALQQVQPFWQFEEPERHGVSVGDSTTRRLVDTAMPECYVKSDRQVWHFSTPGTAILPHMCNQDSGSCIFSVFWQLFRKYLGEVVFVLPAEMDSIPGPDGSVAKTQYVTESRACVEDKIVRFPSLGHFVEATGRSFQMHKKGDPRAVEEQAMEDSVHMTALTSAEMDDEIWLLVDRSPELSKKALVVVIQAYNGEAKVFKQRNTEIAEMWTTLVNWGLATQFEKTKWATQLDIIFGKTMPNPSWYKTSRTKGVRNGDVKASPVMLGAHPLQWVNGGGRVDMQQAQQLKGAIRKCNVAKDPKDENFWDPDPELGTEQEPNSLAEAWLAPQSGASAASTGR